MVVAASSRTAGGRDLSYNYGLPYNSPHNQYMVSHTTRHTTPHPIREDWTLNLVMTKRKGARTDHGVRGAPEADAELALPAVHTLQPVPLTAKLS